ncbi:MAG: hypothetical protein AAB560_02215 [Patescibacteria group bacterium]
MAKQKKRLDPRSGDQLTDWFFRNCLFVLNNIVARISKKENLRDPDRRWRKLDGLLLTESDEVYLEAGLHINDRLVTLIHECLHILLPETRENKILQLEKILWRRFTHDQKKIIKTYIPKHKVKKGPPPSNARDTQ